MIFAWTLLVLYVLIGIYFLFLKKEKVYSHQHEYYEYRKNFSVRASGSEYVVLFCGCGDVQFILCPDGRAQSE